ncbi:AraC-type DNA-binding protein [Methylocapsa palsarum]|uniref:AraC-type DNA-binding protein n=2 Tax=Methylocapsa palsarum TaxID=1612308 RepID=A0A1I3XDU8_9HYPH|nr:AraC-type DNA-binding protein [Methylocapsa palsarum]
MAGVEHCAALSISGSKGVGAVASNFMRASGLRAGAFTPQESAAIADPALDLVTLALASVRPTNFTLSRSRSASMFRIKALLEQRLAECGLNTSMIARQAGLSARYLNDLFGEEGTSLMRYVWRRRLEHCAKEMTDPRHAGDRISDIAFRWGFNDSSHFCRSFKQHFGCAPREYRLRR